MLLFIILVLILSIPAVQTSLGKKATKRINEDYGTHIYIDKVGLQFNGDVEIKEIFVEDYKQDTLISIKELNTSILSFRNLYNGKLVFGDVDIMDLVFNVKTYEGENQTNLDVFVAKFDEENPRTEESGFLLSSSDVSIYDSTFRLTDENKENKKILEFNDLNINASNFLIKGPNVSARINTLAFLDTRGLAVENLIANFEYTREHMLFDNLSINTPNSKLNGIVRFDFNREDLKDFEDKVKVTARFDDANILLDELNRFYNEFGKDQRAELRVDLSGTLNDLIASNLFLTSSSRTKVIGDFNFKNLFNKEDYNFSMDGKFYNLSSNYYDLKAMLPNILGESIPTVFSKLGNFTIKGTSFITATTIDADFEMDTEIGSVISNLKMTHMDDVDNADYSGNVIFTEFDLGELLNDPKVKTVSSNLDVNGKGFTLNNLSTKVNGYVYTLNYNNYLYKNLQVSGTLGNRIFNGLLISGDENFKFRFEGLADMSKNIKALDFTANVEYANLKALNFVKNDTLSIFKGVLAMSMKGSNIDDAFGSLNFKNTTYINENDSYYFNDFSVESKFENNIRILNINSPDIIEGSVSGNFMFKDIGKLIENSLGSIYTNYVPNKVGDNEYLDFNFKIYNKIVEVFYPNLNLGPNTFIKGRVESNEKGFKFTFRSPQIKLFNYFANDISIDIDNSNPLFNTYIEVDSLNTKYYNVSKFSLINLTLRDTLFIKSEFKGGKGNSDDFNLSMFYTINQEGKSVVGFRKSDITFKENTWTINQQRNRQNKVIFDRVLNAFDFSNIVMNHDDEEIQLSGIIRDSTYKNIDLDFKDVDLNKITPRLDSLDFAGNINGKLNILEQESIYLPTSNVEIENFKVNDYELGNLSAKIEGLKSLIDYKVDILLQNNDLKSLVANGFIDLDPENPYIDLNVDFEEFLLNPLNPFGQGVITNIRGIVSGKTTVTGNLNEPQINGVLSLDNAGLTIPYLNVDYSFDFDSQVKLEQQKFIFQDVEITDSKFFSKALLNGYIGHRNFSDWYLNLDVSTDRLLVLNTEDNEESLYYGTAFMDGIANLNGPTDNLVISVEGTTAQGTVFKIPLNDFETYGDNSYIHFLSPEEKQAQLRGENILDVEVKGLELNFDLIINPYADIEIVIDRNSGSTIHGTGFGNLGFEINTNGKFRMFGDFLVKEGTYNFVYGGLIQKKFRLEPNGTLRWEGDPMKALIDLKAVYETQANPSVLLDNPINRSIPVNVEINLTGELEQPEPEFTFKFPNVSSTIRSELEYRLETKESRENQALYLLATGSFASEISLGQQAYGTIADRVNSLFNSLIANENGKVQFGFNYEAGEQTPEYQTDDRLGLTLSTKISDKVLFNGKVGVPIGGINETVIAGDAEIAILLNEDGTLMAKFFNRENNIRNFGEEIGYTQGVGLSYNVEFDTFREFLRIIFSGENKKGKAKTSSENNHKTSQNENFPEYINLKSKTDKKNY